MAVTKEECLSRYHANKEKRMALAQQVIDGRRKIGKHWPKWQQYDVIAEIKVLKEERETAKSEHKRKQAKYTGESK